MTTEWLERLLAAVPGVLMLSNGLSLLADPAGATRSLGSQPCSLPRKS